MSRLPGDVRAHLQPSLRHLFALPLLLLPRRWHEMQSKAPSERSAIIANPCEFKIHEQTFTECISIVRRRRHSAATAELHGSAPSRPQRADGVHLLQLRAWLRRAAPAHPDLLHPGDRQAADGGAQEQVEGAPQVPQEGHPPRPHRHHRVHPLLAPLLDHTALPHIHPARPESGRQARSQPLPSPIFRNTENSSSLL